jgi:hypothetical protein
LFYLEHNVRQQFSTELILFKRYIDDGFALFNGLPCRLEEFKQTLIRDYRLNINFVTSSKSIDFLDLHIEINQGMIGHRTHQKVLNNYQYLPPSSSHDIATFRGIITGELIRYARTCSQFRDFVEISSTFFRRLRERGYTPSFLLDKLSEDGFGESWYVATRTALLNPNRSPTPNENVSGSPTLTRLPPLTLPPTLRTVFLGQRVGHVFRKILTDSVGIPDARPVFILEKSIGSKIIRANDTEVRVTSLAIQQATLMPHQQP